MADFPTALTNAVDGSTDVLAKHLNNLEAKVGIDSSAVTTSHDYKLSGVTGTDKAVSKTGTETLTNKTLSSPVINTPTGDVATKTGTETLTNKTLTTPQIDTINESSSGNGVTIDGLNLKDSALNTANAVSALSMISGGIIQVSIGSALGQVTATNQDTETHWGQNSITPKRSDTTLYAFAILNGIDNGGGGRMSIELIHDTNSGGTTGTTLATGVIAQDSSASSGISSCVLLGTVAPGNTTQRYFKATVTHQDSSTTWFGGRYSTTSYILIVEVR